MRQIPGWIKGLPLTVLLPVFLCMAAVRPDDFVSNISLWAAFFGIQNVPRWFSAPSADIWVKWGSLSLALIYVFFVWGMPYIREKWKAHPLFMLVKVVKNDISTPLVFQLMVRNNGPHFDGHIVKLLELRQASNGAEMLEQAALPVVLQTLAQRSQKRAGRFTLAHGEEKQIYFCSQNNQLGCLRIESENTGWNFLNNDGSGFVATVGLYGASTTTYKFYISIALQQRLRQINVALLDSMRIKEIENRWKLNVAPANSAKKEGRPIGMPNLPEEHSENSFTSPLDLVHYLVRESEWGAPRRTENAMFLATLEAPPLLKEAAADGKISLIGRNGGVGIHEAIPAMFWKTSILEISSLLNGKFETAPAASNHDGIPKYTEVELVPIDFSKIWPRAKELPTLPAMAVKVVPDWEIQELFYHIMPSLKLPQETKYEDVGKDVIDKLSVGQLDIWGRTKNQWGELRPLSKLDPSYWQHADFSYFFLASDIETRTMEPHTTRTPNDHAVEEVFDLRVNKAQALKLWLS